MSTSFQELYTCFNDNIPDSDIANIINDKRLRFLRTSLTKFRKGTGKILTVDFENEIIHEDLEDDDKTLIGLMMHKEFLKQEIQKQNKIMSIATDSMKITGANDRVRELQKMKTDVDGEINELLATYL